MMIGSDDLAANQEKEAVAMRANVAVDPFAGRCASCKWARPLKVLDSEFYEPEEVALNRRYPMECSLAEMDSGKPMQQQTLAFTMDGSSYRASLMVAPEFGCVQWEAKDG